MGQRLNIEVHVNGEVLATAYYHWSAYTAPAVEMTNAMINLLEQEPVRTNETVDAIVTSLDSKLGLNPKKTYSAIDAIRVLEATGALLDERELPQLQSEYPNESFKASVSRNEGIINVYPEGIQTTREWAEGDVVFNLDTRTINFGVVYEYDADEITELTNEGELDEDDVAAMITLENGIVYEEATFAEFKEFTTAIEKVFNSRVGFARLPNGNILGTIE